MDPRWINAPDREGQTALQLAQAVKYDSIVALLQLRMDENNEWDI